MLPTAAPDNLLALALLVFSLGLKHGFDADHLAAIDGLTRYHAAERPRLARLSGALFSLGHGAVVTGVALVVGLLAHQWQPPAWLESLGAWISIFCLFALAALNLDALRRAAPDAPTHPVGIRSRVLRPLLKPLLHSKNPSGMLMVGGLFALSFDTVSQAALFAIAANHFGGWPQVALVSMSFVLGMLTTDAINGFWIARLIRRTDRLAGQASRLMSVGIAAISLLVGGFGLAKLTLPDVAAWSQGREMLFGVLVTLIAMTMFLIALHSDRHQQASHPR